MLAPLQNVVSILTNDSGLASLMSTTIPNAQIYTGDVDVVREQQTTFQYPLLVIHTISDVFERLPLGARETVLQIDSYSRNDELEVVNIYEYIGNLLSYSNQVQGGTRIWWERTTDGHDQSETDMRIFHIPMTLHIWAYDNSPE